MLKLSVVLISSKIRMEKSQKIKLISVYEVVKQSVADISVIGLLFSEWGPAQRESLI